MTGPGARNRKPRDLHGLRARVTALRLRDPGREQLERARAILLSFLDAAIAQGAGFDETLRALKSGAIARTAAATELQRITAAPPEPLTRAACRAGCAFCCLLPGRDGGLILEVEARGLHASLQPLIGQADGQSWHRDACPVLDPETRMCRAYDARPMLCRGYFSVDAAACEDNAAGKPTPGAAMLGAQGVMLAVQSLARAACDGLVRVPSYSLKALARATLNGATLPDALRASRHTPRMLDDERSRLSG